MIAKFRHFVSALRLHLKSLDPPVRTTCITLWLLCVALLVLGVLGDLVTVDNQGTVFWDGKSFLTNVVSSLATACFGIPLALIFLSELSDRSALGAARRDAMKSAHQVASRLRSLTRDLGFPGGSERDLFDDVLSRIDRNTPADSPDVTTFLGLARTWTQGLDAEKFVNTTVPLKQLLKYVDERIRPQFIELGLNWTLTPALEARFTRLLSKKIFNSSIRGTNEYKEGLQVSGWQFIRQNDVDGDFRDMLEFNATAESMANELEGLDSTPQTPTPTPTHPPL